MNIIHVGDVNGQVRPSFRKVKTLKIIYTNHIIIFIDGKVLKLFNCFALFLFW